MAALPQNISQADWDSHRQFIDLPTGIRMSYVEMGNPDGPALVLQHGMTDNNRVWSLSAPRFCQAGYHVFMPDLRGMGYSDEPDGFYTIPQYATDLKAFLDLKGVNRAVMVGHSLGSFVMQSFLLMFPEVCEKVILVASAPLNGALVDTKTFQAMKSLGPDEHPNEAFLDLWYGNENAVPQDFLSRVKAEAGRLSAKAWVNIFGGVSCSNLEGMYPFIPMDIPLLILFGSEDKLVSETIGSKLLTLLPHAEHKTYEGVGHNIQYEIPDQFASDVLSWLRGPEP